MDFSVLTDVIQFNDQAAFATCRELAEKEGLLCGGSSGANVWGCLQVAKTVAKPSTIVTVLPDSGIKYISKIYNDNWLAEHGLKVN
jgi:cystathionine beta-synthase